MEPKLEKYISLKESALTGPVLSILMVEDNRGDVILVTELIKASGTNFILTRASNLKEAYPVCVEKEFDLILLDLGLPESTGLETLNRFRQFDVKSPIVVMTGLDDEDIALESLRQGAQDYLVKNKLTSENILRSIKYGIERKKIQDLLKRNTHQFSILSSATGSISRCEDIISIYRITCESIRLLIEGTKSIAIEFDDSTSVKALFTEWLQPWFEKINTLTGYDLNRQFFNINDRKDSIPALFKDGKVHEIKGGLYEFFEEKISQKDCTELENEIGFNYIYLTGFVKNEFIYGGVIILSVETISNDEINILETIGGHASLSIYKRSIENDLRLSEYHLRRLSGELEQKVNERTKDLESANIRLNQELKERKLAEKALKKSESQLKELNATKDKFFNIIAHDLKNPFTSLLGSSELLYENIDQMDKENIRSLALILNDSAKSGYAILLNLLDWSRSQTGLLRFNPEEINLKELIDENILNLRLFSSNKKITLKSEAKDDMIIFADKNMINTILRNLMSNAVKFTPRGGHVTITAQIRPDEITISVRDTGTGISPENIDKLFRIDTRYSMPGTDNEQGTGLGLKLSKEFIEKQGGKIWVESVENKGSNFMFSIPLRSH